MRHKILIVDDQEPYIRALYRILRDDYDVVITRDVAAARGALTPDVRLGLIDIRLNEEDAANREGIDFIRWLHGCRPDVPCIGMSALESPGLADEVCAAGAALFLQKPIRVSELQKAILDLLERKE